MINVLIYGANGRMGKKVKAALSCESDMRAFCGVDINEDFSDSSFPVFCNIEKVSEKVGKPDVIIDFSSRLSLEQLLPYAEKNGVPAVLCATGYTEEDKKAAIKASEKVALFRSANMSVGVNVLVKLVKQAAKALAGFDVEIIEKHHNQKVDAPSGTAVMIADEIKNVLPEKFCVYGRNGIVGKRDKNEIGIHAVRGGNIVGEHDVLFAGENEVLTLSHSASDRALFADGAVRAARFIAGKSRGLYDMNDLLEELGV